MEVIVAQGLITEAAAGLLHRSSMVEDGDWGKSHQASIPCNVAGIVPASHSGRAETTFSHCRKDSTTEAQEQKHRYYAIKWPATLNPEP